MTQHIEIRFKLKLYLIQFNGIFMIPTPQTLTFIFASYLRF